MLRQWPDLARQVAVCRCYGIENLPRDKFLAGLLVDGEIRSKAILHRDGDFMTSAEARKWKQGFKTPGVYPWVTAGSDIEAYFCDADYLAATFAVSLDEAEAWRRKAAGNVGQARDTFLAKRQNIVRAVWPNGGSPDAVELWNAAGGKVPATVKGKKLHAALKPVVKAAGKNDGLLTAFFVPEGYVVAPELKTLIEEAIAG